jgi:hypothetical protein
MSGPIKPITTAPAAFSGIVDKLNEVIAANPPLQAGKGIKIDTAKENRIISIKLTADDIEQIVGLNALRRTLPFQAYLTAASQIKINAASRLYKSISSTDTLTVSALSTAITLASNTCVWVQVTVSSLAATAATIASGTAYPTLVVTSGSPAAQTQFNVPLGKVTATNPTAPGFEFSISGTAYHFEQCLFNHLLAELRVVNNVPVLFGMPYSGG